MSKEEIDADSFEKRLTEASRTAGTSSNTKRFRGLHVTGRCTFESVDLTAFDVEFVDCWFEEALTFNRCDFRNLSFTDCVFFQSDKAWQSGLSLMQCSVRFLDVILLPTLQAEYLLINLARINVEGNCRIILRETLANFYSSEQSPITEHTTGQPNNRTQHDLDKLKLLFLSDKEAPTLEIRADKALFRRDVEVEISTDAHHGIKGVSFFCPDVDVQGRCSLQGRKKNKDSDPLIISVNAENARFDECLRLSNCDFGQLVGGKGMPAVNFENTKIESLELHDVGVGLFANDESRLQLPFDTRAHSTSGLPCVTGLGVRSAWAQLTNEEHSQDAKQFWIHLSRVGLPIDQKEGREQARTLENLAYALSNNRSSAVPDGLMERLMQARQTLATDRVWNPKSDGQFPSRRPFSRQLWAGVATVIVIMIGWISFESESWIALALCFLILFAIKYISWKTLDIAKTLNSFKQLSFEIRAWFSNSTALVSGIAALAVSGFITSWILPQYHQALICVDEPDFFACLFSALSVWEVPEGALFSRSNALLLGVTLPLVFGAIVTKNGSSTLGEYFENLFRSGSYLFIRDGLRPLLVMAFLFSVWLFSSGVYFFAMQRGYMAPEVLDIYHTEMRLYQTDMIERFSRGISDEYALGDGDMFGKRYNQKSFYHKIAPELEQPGSDPKDLGYVMSVPLVAYFQACRINWARTSMIDREDWQKRVLKGVSMDAKSKETLRPYLEKVDIDELCNRFLPVEYSSFQPFIYAADLVIPLLNLRQEEEWSVRVISPNDNTAQTGAYVVLIIEVLSTIIGWICALALAGAVTGLSDPTRRPY